MPTETKNSTANASRIGSASDAARWLYSDWPTIIPARKAPSAIDTLKAAADPTAMLRAMTRTASVKSSRERVRAMWSSTVGMTRVPTSAAKATSATTFSAVHASTSQRGESDVARPKRAGSTTSAMTVNKSSTTSHPTATCPKGVCRWLESDRTRTSTTVLATPSASPNTIAPAHSQPNDRASSVSKQGGHAAGREGAGNGDATDRQQLVHVKLQAHTEHQQDDADLGQLFGYRRIGDEARRVGADHQPCYQVPDDRRQADATREVSRHQRGGEAAGEREDQAVAGHRDI